MGKPTLPITAVQQFLHNSIASTATQLEPLPEGEESQAFRFIADGQAYVIRINPAIARFKKDHYAHHHFHGPFIPSPHIFAIGHIDENHAFCISEYLVGGTLQAADQQTLRRLLKPTLQTWSAISQTDISHTIGYGDVDHTGAGRFASWQAYLGSLFDARYYQWAEVATGVGAAELGRLLQPLQASIVCMPELRALVHGDFGANNLLTDGLTITGVLDWDCALYGDPLFDIATAYLVYAPLYHILCRQARIATPLREADLLLSALDWLTRALYEYA